MGNLSLARKSAALNPAAFWSFLLKLRQNIASFLRARQQASSNVRAPPHLRLYET
jgi:hypothetical protein